MSNLHSGPSREFRPTRTTRSTAGAAGTSAATTTNSSRARSTSRPPSGIGAPTNTNGLPASSSGIRVASRPGSAAGFVPTTTRIGTGIGVSRASAPPAGSGPTAAASGTKRKTRATSSGTENGQESAAAKRPALSSAFSAHVTQSSLSRQLLDAQAQITKLQNDLIDKQRDVDRLETDLRLVAMREEEEREARTRSEEELARKTTRYETELSSLKRKLAELEADHEDLDDAYSNLARTSQSKIAALNLELTTRDERIALLETQLNEAEARAREEESRAKALEELLEQVTEEGAVVEEMEEEEAEHNDKQTGQEEKQPENDQNMTIEIEEPETSVADMDSPKAVTGDNQAHDVNADADAEGEAEEEDVSMSVDNNEGDGTPTGEIEIISIRSASVASEQNVFYEGGQQEIEAYPDPGAPPPYNVSSPPTPASPASASVSTASRSRSVSVTSSRTGSIASSRAMSITLDGPPLHYAPRSPGTPLSTASSSRLDPLSHIRQRLSFATPSRRRSSIGPDSALKRERDKDNEIIRAELARQTSHITSLEATNARLTSELARLRARAEGTEVLREEKRELERRVEGMEALRSRVAELETAAAEFAQREREWAAKLRERERGVNDENATPVGVTKQLAALRRAHASLLDEHGELKATLRVNEIELATAHEEAENASREAERLQKQVEHLQHALARKEKERVLLERDATFLRSLVSSYKNEEAADLSMETGEEPSLLTPGTEKLEQRIEQLEALLSEYKVTIESLEKEVDWLQRSGGKVANRPQEQWDQLLNRATTLEEAFKNAHAEVTRQADRVEELEQRLFELGGEIGGGRHIPPATRVLSLRQNPAQEWADTRKAVLDRLKAENEALLARLKELEEQGFSAQPSATDANSSENVQLVPRASWEALKKEAEEQRAALEQKEKRLLRLQQVYTAKSVEFREAIESILGLKLAFYPNGQVRLTSVYDLSATFVFQPSQEGADRGGAKLQLIATGDGGPQELEGLMSTWIRDEMCIPCFMSSVTLECYDKRKSEQRAAGLLRD